MLDSIFSSEKYCTPFDTYYYCIRKVVSEMIISSTRENTVLLSNLNTILITCKIRYNYNTMSLLLDILVLR